MRSCSRSTNHFPIEPSPSKLWRASFRLSKIAATTARSTIHTRVFCSSRNMRNHFVNCVRILSRWGCLQSGCSKPIPKADKGSRNRSKAPFLRAHGIGAIITLFEKPLEPDPAELGFQYFFVETPNFRPPPDLGIVLVFMEAQLERGCGVLVHCFAGIGRSGTVLTAWLIRQDTRLSAAAAISQVRDEYIPKYARLRFPEHPSQAEALDRFARER